MATTTQCDHTELRQSAVAVFFRITDMGNGVDRIEHAKRVESDSAAADAELADNEPLPRPTPPRILHAALEVFGALGIEVSAHSGLLIQGYSRLVSAQAIDVVVWVPVLA